MTKRYETKNEIKNFSNISVIPTRTKDNKAVIFANLRDTSYYNFHLEPILAYGLMCLESTLYKNPPHGFLIVIDMKGFGLLHLTRLRLGTLKKFFEYLQEGLPCQLKRIHVLNAVFFMDKVLSLLKPFMSKELLSLVNKT